ncbi:MAG: hypothetical protein Q8L45_01730 [Xanthomonadaceae bacterium]|nr:hypothetical protein [Xanthomonadaceae bacterium]MDP2185019.1 hypothetical protein [Xanthomonadales bacterium]MDZ4114398.1 hypothetical protein [Xanthomonadaceae bacterium]
MLKFVKTDTFRANVNVCLPGSDPQKPVEGSFVATYRHFDRAGFEALVDEQLGDAAFLGRVLVAVDGIGDDSGNAIAPEAQRELVISDIALGAAAVRAFVENLSGAAAKNAKPSRAR